MKIRILALFMITCMLAFMVPSASAAEVLYPICVVTEGEGKVILEDPVAAAGENVTVTVKPDKGYKVKVFEVEDYFGNYIESEENYDNTFSFTMPDNMVKIEVKFFTEEPQKPDELPFFDVSKDKSYYDAVKFVYDIGLFSGVDGTTFAPKLPMSRGMLVTVFFRLAGEPDIYGEDMFSDVYDNMYCKDAVIWAQGCGIVSGYGHGVFGTEDLITREQAAVVLWRYAGCPMANGELPGFYDRESISGYAVEALTWALENEIITVKGKNNIAPKDNATRAEIAVMLWKYLTADE